MSGHFSQHLTSTWSRLPSLRMSVTLTTSMSTLALDHCYWLLRLSSTSGLGSWSAVSTGGWVTTKWKGGKLKNKHWLFTDPPRGDMCDSYHSSFWWTICGTRILGPFRVIVTQWENIAIYPPLLFKSAKESVPNFMSSDLVPALSLINLKCLSDYTIYVQKRQYRKTGQVLKSPSWE